MRTWAGTLAVIALAAAAPHTADGPRTGAVIHISASDVASAFAMGRPLLEMDVYKIHASRREAPGQAEIHARDTDVIYVLEGGATIVTGGSVIDARTIGPDEVRGASISGGDTRRLAKGDVLVVPEGVPHWFQRVDAPLLYYVVKVAAPRGGTQ